MHVKGITQTCECCQWINFHSIKQLVEVYVENSKDDIITAKQHSIVHDKKVFHLKNSTVQKRFRVVYDKRHLLAHGQTVPFGY